MQKRKAPLNSWHAPRHLRWKALQVATTWLDRKWIIIGREI